MRTGDVFKTLKETCSPDPFDLRTAEGRADWDDALRSHLSEIYDPVLRAHAADMVKHWRRDVFAKINREIFETIEYEIFSFADTGDGNG